MASQFRFLSYSQLMKMVILLIHTVLILYLIQGEKMCIVLMSLTLVLAPEMVQILEM